MHCHEKSGIRFLRCLFFSMWSSRFVGGWLCGPVDSQSFRFQELEKSVSLNYEKTSTSLWIWTCALSEVSEMTAISVEDFWFRVVLKNPSLISSDTRKKRWMVFNAFDEIFSNGLSFFVLPSKSLAPSWQKFCSSWDHWSVSLLIDRSLAIVRTELQWSFNNDQYINSRFSSVLHVTACVVSSTMDK